MSGALLLVAYCLRPAFSQTGKYEQIVFGCYTDDINDFEQFVAQAKDAGATHVQLISKDLPLAYWQMDPPGDPYPAWVITNPGI